MLTVAFVLPAFALPVPDRKGGAIETLMTMLLEQNEEAGEFRFIFISPGSEDSLLALKHSKCYICSANIANLPFDVPYPTEKNAAAVLEAYPYDYKANLIAKHERADYIIMEGAALRIQNCFMDTVPRERLAMHLHCQMERRGVFTEAFGITIAPSQFIATDWNKLSPENINNTFLLRNRIRTERFMITITEERKAALRKTLGFDKDDFIILYCGRLAAVKGVAELISSVLTISDKNVKLLLIGTDSFAEGNKEAYAERILHRVESHKDRICYLGYIDNFRLPMYYQIADMQAIPSLGEEAVGLVALEGMCSGLPLVLTNSGGMVEYVPDSAGLKIERDKEIVQNLVRSILWMKNHPAERMEMGRQGRSVAQGYSSDCYYQDFRRLMKWWERRAGPQSDTIQ